jgi:cell division protein FtsZ
MVYEDDRGPMPVIIKIVGIGGGGTNAINRMIDSNLSGVEFVVVNTDLQDLLQKSRAAVKIQIGKETTRGRGAGGNPQKGEAAAEEDAETIREHIRDADMVFITAGMGGGTGTGAAPVIAQIAKKQGILTVAIVTTPFDFEGTYKMDLAEKGIAELRKSVDTLIVIPNQQLYSLVDRKTPLLESYRKADEVLCEGVRGISDLITKTGIVNIDFADVESTMKDQGDALLGIGIGTGENRAVEAAEKAIKNPLLVKTSMAGATHLLINFLCDKALSLVDVQDAVKIIGQNADPNVNIIHGITLSEDMGDNLLITVVATGLKSRGMVDGTASESVKPKETDFIDMNEWQRIRDSGAAKQGDFLSRRGGSYSTEDDLEVPAIVRKTPKDPLPGPDLFDAKGL